MIDALRYPNQVLVAPGFAAPAETYRYLMESLRSAGFDSVCPNYQYVHNKEPRKWGFVPDVDRLKQQTILNIARKGGPIDVIAHSKGAIDVVSAALVAPTSFRNLVLVAPGGVHPEKDLVHSLLDLQAGDTKDKADKAALEAKIGDPDNIFAINRAGSHQYQKDWSRYWPELITAASSVIYEDFNTLRMHGLRVVVVSHENDSMFPPEIYRPLVANRVDEFVSMVGIHGSIKFERESAEAITDLLQSIQA